MRKAVILLSGGLDSTTVLALAQQQGFSVYALSFRYGQRHLFELTAAKKIATQAKVAEHRIIDIDLAAFGGSALTDNTLDVPKNQDIEQMSEQIPITYVPARNTIFLSFALAWAEVLEAKDIFIGVNALDFSGYPDCRPEYIQAYEKMANLATKIGTQAHETLRIHTPLIQLSKTQIIQQGIALGVDYSQTHSCYAPNAAGESCGSCDACLLRLNGFSGAGLKDVITYQ